MLTELSVVNVCLVSIITVISTIPIHSYIDILPSTESSLVTHSTQLKITTQTYL